MIIVLIILSSVNISITAYVNTMHYHNINKFNRTIFFKNVSISVTKANNFFNVNDSLGIFGCVLYH